MPKIEKLSAQAKAQWEKAKPQAKLYGMAFLNMACQWLRNHPNKPKLAYWGTTFFTLFLLYLGWLRPWTWGGLVLLFGGFLWSLITSRHQEAEIPAAPIVAQMEKEGGDPAATSSQLRLIKDLGSAPWPGMTIQEAQQHINELKANHHAAALHGHLAAQNHALKNQIHDLREEISTNHEVTRWQIHYLSRLIFGEPQNQQPRGGLMSSLAAMATLFFILLAPILFFSIANPIWGIISAVVGLICYKDYRRYKYGVTPTNISTRTGCFIIIAAGFIIYWLAEKNGWQFVKSLFH